MRITAWLLAACALIASLLIPATAHASTHDEGSALGNAILDTAESRAGDWYAYGAAGPGAFDCSGLVYWAAAQHGIDLPRTTYGMLAGSPHLYQIPLADARRGDLLFYGSGHVEFATDWYHTSFGAHDTGSRVGWISWGYGWQPTMAMRFG
jgi:cell wall-associated NlpC family hydrolase